MSGVKKNRKGSDPCALDDEPRSCSCWVAYLFRGPLRGL